jgi:hypothetical protein
MPKIKTDIIEQLEKGKELLESGEIDVKFLKTKVESTDKENKEISKKRKRVSKSGTDDNNISDIRDDKDFSNISDNSNVNNSISADNNQENKQIKQEKVEKYPGFDFNTTYAKGQTIFYVRVNELIGEKEIQELTIRSVYPKTIIGCLEKSYTQCIGPDTADRIFRTRYEALECYNNIVLQQKIYEH